MGTVYAVGQYIIFVYVKSKIKCNTKNRFMLNIHKILYIPQFVLIGLIVIIIWQMISLGSFATIFLKSITWINYIMASVLFGFFGIRLFLWDRLNRNYVLILYSMAMLGLSIACITTTFYVTNQIEQRGFDSVFPVKSIQIFIAGTDNDIFSTLYFITSVISFILIWIATVFLLRHYSTTFGRTKYWIMVLIPLIYFLTQYQSFIPDLFDAFHKSDPISYGVDYTLFFNMSKPIGGILFGLAFWSIAKSLKKSVVKDYMTISAYGIMLFFTVNQPVSLTLIPYPPFGLSTICFVGLSSYLVIIGIYSSAISMS